MSLNESKCIQKEFILSCKRALTALCRLKHCPEPACHLEVSDRLSLHAKANGLGTESSGGGGGDCDSGSGTA